MYAVKGDGEESERHKDSSQKDSILPDIDPLRMDKSNIILLGPTGSGERSYD